MEQLICTENICKQKVTQNQDDRRAQWDKERVFAMRP